MSESKNKKLSRRDAIKILGAAAGAAMLANLPSRWTKPELATGVLPAHAQTSCGPLTITSVSINPILATPPPVGGCFLSVNLIVQISATQANVPMMLQSFTTGSVTWAGGAPPDGTYLTDPTGAAQVYINVAYDQILDFKWSFLNASDGCSTRLWRTACT